MMKIGSIFDLISKKRNLGCFEIGNVIVCGERDFEVRRDS